MFTLKTNSLAWLTSDGLLVTREYLACVVRILHEIPGLTPPSFSSYIVYGPLALGVTTTFFESTPVYPDASRYWDFVDKHKITQFYTAPTVSIKVDLISRHPTLMSS